MADSETGYESQTRAAFFKGDVGALLDTSSAEVDLESVIIRPEDIEEEEEEHRNIVISSSQIMVRNDSRSIVLGNAHATADDARESVSPISLIITESTDRSNSPEDERESTPRNVQVVTQVPSGVVMENPVAVEEERETISPSSQVIVDGLEAVIVENLCAEGEADNTAPQMPQMPTSEITEEQGCAIIGNPDTQIEERDAMQSYSGSRVEGSFPLEDQVIVHG
jgi:hypothetical protein